MFSSGPTNSTRGTAYLDLGNNNDETTTIVVDRWHEYQRSDPVGHHLTSKAEVFGRDTLTATDIVVAAGENTDNLAPAQSRMETMLKRVTHVVKTSHHTPFCPSEVARLLQRAEWSIKKTETSEAGVKAKVMAIDRAVAVGALRETV
ncbi:hypothetical protein KEM54_003027 [Ascosphaera aggregata]|nr:hypothetical protein KEM54_003027 [Ascosphaera aggregata]